MPTNIKSAVSNLIQVPDGKVMAHALGRVGNQMFVTVAAMTYARRSGREFEGLAYDRNSLGYRRSICDNIMRNVKCVDGVVNSCPNGYLCIGTDDWLCNGFPDTDHPNIYFNDFFQDVRCLDKDIAYDLFKPHDSILETINKLYGDLSDVVCVNVRRGDYLNIRGLGFNVYSKEEIDSIINEYFRNDRILFVSDDIRWCKANFSCERYMFADKPYPNKIEIDLYIQTQCKSNVISNSTFSWWGAFLNDHAEKVVCRWPWFHSGKISPMEYVLPEDWIKKVF